MPRVRPLFALLLVLFALGASACADATGPRPDTQPCTEGQSTGGRTC